MITVAFFNQNFLMQKEITDALRRVSGVRLAVINMPDYPAPQQAQQACDALSTHGVRMLFTVNDWGMGLDNVVAEFLTANSILHVNWCADDPFFYETFHGHPLRPVPNRIDFVSDRSYVAAMRSRGMNAHFAPLASDPALFAPALPHPGYKRTSCFVGNSYVKQAEAFTKDYEPYFDSLIPFVTSLYSRYRQDPALDLSACVAQQVEPSSLPPGMSVDKAVFVLKHLVSYVFRKRLIVSLARRYPDFTVFGDEWWLLDLPREKISTEVGYYVNLSRTYQETRVNIDVNRVVIREGLTQRVFDCLASGAFVITSAKPVLQEFFETTGDAKEVVVFDNEQHLGELIDYYASHDSERAAIVERGRRRVLSEHTYDHRIAEIFRIVSGEIGGNG
jgi:spore maturation protein CgeB